MNNLELINHTRRTMELVDKFGRSLNLSREELKDLYLGAKYHDIGKNHINQNILYKKEKLTKKEFDELKKHPDLSYRFLCETNNFNKNVLDIVRQHHERIDGKGYPLGLKGNEIFYLTKILSICDSYEAMTANRCYKKALTEKEAIKEIKKCLGTQFDKKIGLKFINFIENHENQELTSYSA